MSWLAPQDSWTGSSAFGARALACPGAPQGDQSWAAGHSLDSKQSTRRDTPIMLC